MLINKKYTLIFSLVFIIIEITLSTFIQLTSGNINTVLSFFAIVLACIFPLLFMNKGKKYIYTQIGLICTVLADLFLVVIKPMYQIPAMCFFSITQICYFLRIYLNQTKDKEKLYHIIIRVISIIIVLLITIIVLKDKTDLLSLISMFYYTNLVINIIYAFIDYKTSLILAIGLLLFACCDLLIGLDILDSTYLEIKEGSLLYFLCNLGFNLAWVFYVPSQTLIALSIINKNTLDKNI